REQGPAFEAGAVPVAEDGDEVVEDPRAVEAEGVGLLPGGEEVVPGDVLIGGLDAEADVRGRLRQRGPGEKESQGVEDGGAHAAALACPLHPGQSPASTSAQAAGRSAAPRQRSRAGAGRTASSKRSEEHTSELQSRFDLVCRLLLEKKNKTTCNDY